MKKTLSDRITENQNKKPKGKKRSAKSEFIALKKDISEAIDNGHSMLAIWQTLSEEGQISFGYKSFRNYVITLIKSEESGASEGANQSSETDKKIKGFNFNPIPKIEDLI
jgi:hypothetical protein